MNVPVARDHEVGARHRSQAQAPREVLDLQARRRALQVERARRPARHQEARLAPLAAQQRLAELDAGGGKRERRRIGQRERAASRHAERLDAAVPCERGTLLIEAALEGRAHAVVARHRSIDVEAVRGARARERRGNRLRDGRRRIAGAERDAARLQRRVDGARRLASRLPAQRELAHVDVRRQRQVRAGEGHAARGRLERPGEGRGAFDAPREIQAEGLRDHREVGRAEGDIHGIARAPEAALRVEMRFAERDRDVGARNALAIARDVDTPRSGEARVSARRDVDLRIAGDTVREGAGGDEREVEIAARGLHERGGVEVAPLALEAEVPAPGEGERALAGDGAAARRDARRLHVEALVRESGAALDLEARILERHVEALAVLVAGDGDAARRLRLLQSRVQRGEVHVGDMQVRFDHSIRHGYAPAGRAAARQLHGEIGDLDTLRARDDACGRRGERQALAIPGSRLGVHDPHGSGEGLVVRRECRVDRDARLRHRGCELRDVDVSRVDGDLLQGRVRERLEERFRGGAHAGHDAAHVRVDRLQRAAEFPADAIVAILDLSGELAAEIHRERARVAEGPRDARVAVVGRDRRLVHLPARLVALALEDDVFQHQVLLGRRRKGAQAQRADAAVLEAHRVGRRERHRELRRFLRGRGAHFHALRVEPVHDERSAERRRGIHLEVVDAHVESGAVDDDGLHAQHAVEPSLDAFHLRALAHHSHGAGEEELGPARRMHEPIDRAARDRDHEEDGEEDCEAPAAGACHVQNAIVTENASRNLWSRPAYARSIAKGPAGVLKRAPTP